MTLGDPAPAIDDPLLDHLRGHLGLQGLDYAEAPTRLFGGNNTYVYALRLKDAPPPWNGPLVVRILKAHRASDEVIYETTLQNAVAELGVAAPRVLLAETSNRPLGGAFQVMEQIGGRALLLGDVGAEVRGLRMLGVILRNFPAAALGPWPERLARVHSELHRRPSQPLAAALETVGMRKRASIEYRLERLRGWIRELDQPQLEAVLDTLCERAPGPDAPSVICHGDLFPNQVFHENGTIAGIIDWADTVIGPPEFDVGLVEAGLAAVPVALPGAGALQRRLVARFVAAYQRTTPLDPERRHFGRIFRGVAVLCALARYRAGTGPAPVPYDSPRGAAIVTELLGSWGVRVSLR